MNKCAIKFPVLGIPYKGSFMLTSELPAFPENSPEKIWRQALAEFATAHALPVEDVVSGRAFTCNGLGFRLQYNVDFDAEGLAVIMDLGPIPEESRHAVQLAMLSHNARRPSALMGYFGMPIGERRGAYAVRLDLKKLQKPAMAIADMVEGLARSTFASLGNLRDTFQAATGINPDDIKPQT